MPSWSRCRSTFGRATSSSITSISSRWTMPTSIPTAATWARTTRYTSWLMSPCAKSGKLDCSHCHTPSGRMRFEGQKANQTCMPCHAEGGQDSRRARPPQGRQPGQRVHRLPHADDALCGDGTHRPLDASAHSGPTIAFKSPNACNLCHADHDAAWADRWVRKWYRHDYQADVLRRAELIDRPASGSGNACPKCWPNSTSQGDDEVYKTSLVRLLRGCDDAGKWPVAARAACRIRRRWSAPARRRPWAGT